MPPTDVEMAEAVEARIPGEEEDMQEDTKTEAPAPSVDSTAKSEEIVMGRVPERRKLGDKFFRANIVGSQVSSSLEAYSGGSGASGTGGGAGRSTKPVEGSRRSSLILPDSSRYCAVYPGSPE